MLMPLFVKVADTIMEYIEKDNQDMIQRYVYDEYQPEYYERTMEFKEAWKATKAESHGNVAEASFGQAPEMMLSIPEEFIHGSPSWGDARDYMAELIYQGKSGPMFGKGEWQKKRNAFNKLVSYLGKHRFDSYVRRAFKSVGLDVTKIRGSKK